MSSIAMSVSDFESDFSRQALEVAEALEAKCGHALTIWEHLRNDVLVAEGTAEARLAEVKRLREQAGEERSQAAHLRRFKDRSAVKLSAADEKKMNAHESRATKLLAKAESLGEEARKSSGIYPIARLDQWAASILAGAQREGVKRYDAARRSGEANEDASSIDYVPSLIFTPHIVETPRSIDKVILMHAKAQDQRAALLAERRKAELAGLPIDEVVARAMSKIASMGRPITEGTAHRLVKTFAGDRRVPGEIELPTKIKAGTASEFEPDPLAILFWILRPQLEEAVTAKLKDSAPAGEAMNAQARVKAFEEINAKLTALEYEESAACWRCITAGHKVFFRADMAPAAVLMVDVEFGEAPGF